MLVYTAVKLRSRPKAKHNFHRTGFHEKSQLLNCSTQIPPHRISPQAVNKKAKYEQKINFRSEMDCHLANFHETKRARRLYTTRTPNCTKILQDARQLAAGTCSTQHGGQAKIFCS
jgi:hypothetical protein